MADEYAEKTLYEIAETYGEKRLEQILAYLDGRNLKGTGPYAHFKEVLNSLNHSTSYKQP